MNEHATVTYIFVALGTFVYYYLLRWFRPSKHQLSHIPAMGPTAPIISYWGAVQWLARGTDICQEGYNKYKGRAFKVANFNRWLVIVSGPKLIDEVRKASDDELSFIDAANENLEIEYTAGLNVANNPYHVHVIRGQLTRGLPSLFPEARDEVIAAFNEHIPMTDDWTPYVAHRTLMQIVARTSNRIFVGLPLCRNKEYLKLCIQFTIDVIVASNVITQFPTFMKPFVARFLTRVPAAVQNGINHLGPLITHRLDMLNDHGNDWPDKPNDVLSWLIDTANEDERTVRNLVLRILTVNFAAIHTTSMSFSFALFHLAAAPEYIEVLRKDVDQVVRAEGWSKASLDKMHKVDSFLKECQRMYALGCVSMVRRARKDFTFSDGTFLPEGTFVGTALLPMQHEEEYYEYSETFNPWRFSDIREREGASAKHSFVSTSIEYHPFGHGRHACPGRFFAATEMKSMMAHLVLNYDVKMEKEGVLPPPLQFGAALMPDPKINVMFRKRQT